ncbi:MAG: cysteine--tRNA ligase [Candidatus Xiphinematobacter sp.]|nr:MAG: cysteine--tRNA ligase [Candidatus Xiphinematobacter sp.]
MLAFFNTLTRRVEEFSPLDPKGKTVLLYTCGPTVYDLAHIGNFRAYVFEDLLQRHLEFRGFNVRRVMNLTDVEDKTIRACHEAGTSLADFTRPFKEAFFQDLNTLRIRRAEFYPEASAPVHIGRMIEMIATLIKRGHAYQATDGSVYFRLSTFPMYGRLAHFHLDELRPSGRVKSDEYGKENMGDFALWKAWDEKDNAVGWDSPWGVGRPGWHIECSAMATGILGPSIDIHCGGEDNIFPHHEAEIAQSECVTGKPFVRLWMHCRHLLVNGQKMSKSRGNSLTLRDLLYQGWTGREVRYVLASTRYREPLNFTFESLAGARSTLRRLDEWTQRLHSRISSISLQSTTPVPPQLDTAAFGRALDNDLNTSAALGNVFDIVRDSNRLLDQGKLSFSNIAFLEDWIKQVHSVFCLEPNYRQLELPNKVTSLLLLREQARAKRQWNISDSLRKEILALGWNIKDTKQGQEVSW